MNRFDFHILASKYLPINLVKHIIDIICLISSYLFASYMLSSSIKEGVLVDLSILVCLSLIISHLLGLYHHLWRYTSLYNVLGIFKHCFVLTLCFAVWSYFTKGSNEQLFKLSFLFALFLFTAMNLSRILIRLIFEQAKINSAEDSKNIILIGAGKGAELFIRESKKRPFEVYNIKGILDDDPTLWGKKIFGIKVFGPIKEMSKLASLHAVDMAIIAIPSLKKERLIEITTLAEDLRLHVRVLPSFDKLLITKEFSPEDISVEDLLGRDSINLDVEELSNFIKGKSVLITGAGGSIGSEICRQLIKLNPDSVIMVDHSEYNLYKISWELEHTTEFSRFIPILANVCDKNGIEAIFKAYKPQVVFHAAAYKHVPLLEKQAAQAISNNFLGTKNVAELASQYGSEKFILISTDKAVNPTNVMGSTKRMAEIFCQNFNKESKTSYITVRFGNVLGSAGSVVPLFKKQLKEGGPLTVTHPEITRFFMSIPEASQLVLQAGAMGQGGEIFVLDMGASIKIADLAERMITLSGKRPYKDVDIVFTGLRPGEKLYEELFYENEDHLSTKRKKIFLATSRSLDFEDFLKKTKVLEKSLKTSEEEKLIELISEMVPEAQLSLSPKSIYGVDKKDDIIAA